MRLSRRVGFISATSALFLLGATAPAFATTSTMTATMSGGSLSIGTPTPSSLSVTVGGIATGTLPAAAWSDTTGTGNGWNGTVAISDFTFNSGWFAVTGTTDTLASSGDGGYTGTADGVAYTVTVKSGGSTSSTLFTYTSNTTVDPSGSGTATNGTPASVGTQGLKVTFASGTAYAVGDQFAVHVGTMNANAIALDSAASGASIAASSGSMSSSSPPAFASNNTVLTGGGVGVVGSPVRFITAPTSSGMGTYQVAPGITFASDASAWVSPNHSYTGTVVYTIASGP